MVLKKYLFKLIALLFLLLAICSYPWETEFSTSVIPGWHVTVIQAYPYSLNAITFLLLFNVVVYSFLRVEKLPWKFALFHLISALPSLFVFRRPLLFISFDNISHYYLLPLDTVFLLIADCFFFCVQLAFIILLIRAVKKKNIP